MKSYDFIKSINRWKQNECVVKKVLEKISIKLNIPRNSLHYDLIKGRDETIIQWNIYYENKLIMSSYPLKNDDYDIIENEDYIYLNETNEEEIYDYIYRKILHLKENDNQ